MSKKVSFEETAARFERPAAVTKLDMAFGGDMNVLLPDYDFLRDAFMYHKDHGKWENVVSTWFFCGLPDNTDFIPKEGIDPKAALTHIGACLRSFAPKHEHKTLGCAYLLWRWFEDVKMDQEAVQQLKNKMLGR
jgi:hypothetical protein